MTEEEVRLNFGQAVKKARKEKSLTQDRLSKKINEQFPDMQSERLYQERISQLERGVLNLTKEHVDAIQEVLHLPEDDVAPILEQLENEQKLKTDKRIVPIKVMETGKLISRGTSQEFQPYLGEYHCLFISTDSSSKEPVRGLLKITPGDDNSDQCTARVTVYDKKGKEIKWYSGPFFINTRYGTWHCILVGHKWQEICMLIASHFNSTIHPNLLNVALVLTTSSGLQKRPTMHRILFSRNRVSKKEALELVQAQLRLNTDNICISKTALDSLQADMEKALQGTKAEKKREKYQAVLTCIEKIREMGKKEEFYTMAESIIYDSNTIISDKQLRSYVVSKIRASTDSMNYNKISQTVQNICVDIVGGRK